MLAAATAARRERVAPVVRARRGAVLRRRVLAAHWPAVVRHGALQRPVRRAALQAAQLHLLLRPAHPAQRPPHPRGARPAAVQDPRAGDALRESRYSELQHGAASGVDSGDGPCGPRPRRVLARDQQAAARARLHAARAQPRPRRELQVGLPARAQPVLPAPLHRHEGAPQAVRRRRSLQRPTQGGLESPQQVARPRAVRTAVRERLYARGASRQHDRPQEDHAGERVREHARALRLQRGERLRPRAPLPPALLLRRAPLVGRALLHDARGQVTAAPRLR